MCPARRLRCQSAVPQETAESRLSGSRMIPEEDNHHRDGTKAGPSCRGCPWSAPREGVSWASMADLRSRRRISHWSYLRCFAVSFSNFVLYKFY